MGIIGWLEQGVVLASPGIAEALVDPGTGEASAGSGGVEAFAHPGTDSGPDEASTDPGTDRTLAGNRQGVGWDPPTEAGTHGTTVEMLNTGRDGVVVGTPDGGTRVVEMFQSV